MDCKSFFEQIKGKKIAMCGIGVSNTPLILNFLNKGAKVYACDRRTREMIGETADMIEKAGAELRLGEGYLDNLEVDIIFRTPGMNWNLPELDAARKKGIAVTSEMEVFFELCPCYIIAVTGSDGKTTTTTLVSEMLKKSGKTVWLGGNIGTPLLPLVKQMQPEDYAVVELSSFQLMDMHHSPARAVVTNLAPNHLDVHKDMEEYVAAKTNIFRYQGKEDLLILNGDNAITDGFTGKGITRKFSRQGQAHVCIREGFICRGGQPVLAVEDILLPGVHNIENYMAAIAAVEGLVADDVIRHVAKTFGGVEHRIELVRIKDGVRFYNDSIASSPSRTIAGLRSFSEKVILIAGGYDKHIPYDVLGPEVCAHVKQVFLCGATAPQIRTAVENCADFHGQVEMTDCGNFENAVRTAAAAAAEGDVVLMSPASASFDEFKNFMVRGEFFKKIVKEL